jgi:hypothetical protein
MRPTTLRDIICLPAPADFPVTAAEMRAIQNDSSRQHAKFLNQQCGVPFHESCNRASHDPLGDQQDQAAAFVCAVAGICLLLIALVLA